ncbi:MAG: hypothetical protein ACRCUJ_01765 [Phocaeicola sp.]
MANNYIDFAIRIQDQGSESIKKISVNADDLNKGLRAVTGETEKLNAKLINMSQLSQAMDGIQSVVSQIQGTFKGWTAATQVQIVAETQLETVMGQRMKATKDDIQSIKDLCSAQQQLGVIGDEVQLSGAQQVATFIDEKESLDTLIPAMNNLLAQQKGLNATNQDAVSIGNLMGKVMQGQTSALTRVGITFSEAEEKVLKYGTESERAAMLAQVVTNNVGEMNAALAATDAGQQKQLENTLGDVKERLGELVQGAAPFIEIGSQAVIASSGAMKMAASMSAAVAGIKSLELGTKAAAIATKAFQAVQAALNVVMSANPISLVILALAALAAGVVYCYKHFDGFREVCDTCFAAVKKIAAAVWEFLVKAFEKASAVIKKAWDYVRAFFGWKSDGVEENTAAIEEQAKAVDNTLGLLEKYANAVNGAGGTKPIKVATEMAPPEGSIKELEKQIQAKQLEFSLAINTADRVRIDAELIELENKKRTIELDVVYNIPVMDERQSSDFLSLTRGKDNKEGMNVDKITPPTAGINEYTNSLKDAQLQQDAMQDSMYSLGDVFGSLGDAIGGAAGQWLAYGASVVQAIAQAIPAIVGMLAAKDAETQKTNESTTAKVANASAGVMEAHASIPFVGIALGLAGIAAIVAAMSSIPKFASGGIISGPTIGLMGEYAGAANNPEVVAPLNKLKSMLEPQGGGVGGKVTFELHGRTLRGLLDNTNNASRRS